MKILFVLDKTFPPDPRVENELNVLLKAGHKITLFCLRHSKLIKEKENPKYNFEIHRLYLSKFLYKFSALAYSLPIYSILIGYKLRQFLKENEFDVIHVHDIQAASFVPFDRNYKYILDFHEYRSEIMKQYKHVQSFAGKILIKPKSWQIAEKKYALKSDKLIVVTEEAKEIICNKFELTDSKVAVVPNSVPIAYARGAKIEYGEQITLLYLGDTGERRGLVTAIHGLKKVIDAGYEVRLKIVGSSSYDVVLKKLTKELNLEGQIEFAGWVEPEKFHDFLKVSHIGISPLHRNLHHDTTYANKIMQYLAYGLPLLVSDSTAQKLLVEKYNCGLVHIAQDSNSFANELIKMITDKMTYSNYVKEAFSSFNNFLNWEKVSVNLIEIYSSLQNSNEKL
jgi:glycosyltransferase involved in cell wall biosynthesis